MIRHVVMFKWNEGIDEAHVAATAAALERLPGLIPQIRSYTLGRDLGVASANFDFAVTGEFESVESFVQYRDHPDHQAVVQTYIAPHISERAAVQFQVS